jgi:hypothetical protein
MTPFLVPAAVQTARRFDVQPAGEAVIHAMSRHAVREAVYTRRFNATTRVRHDGGSWGLIGGYPEFAEVLRLLGDDLSPMAGTRKLAGWGRASPPSPSPRPPAAPPPAKPPDDSAVWAAAPEPSEPAEPEALPSWPAVTSPSRVSSAPPAPAPTPTPTIAAPWAPDLPPLDPPIPALSSPPAPLAVPEPALAPLEAERPAPRTPPPIQMPHAEPTVPAAPHGRGPIFAIGGLVFVVLLAVFVLSG